jgi:hypothetical protein
MTRRDGSVSKGETVENHWEGGGPHIESVGKSNISKVGKRDPTTRHDATGHDTINKWSNESIRGSKVLSTL